MSARAEIAESEGAAVIEVNSRMDTQNRDTLLRGGRVCS